MSSEGKLHQEMKAAFDLLKALQEQNKRKIAELEAQGSQGLSISGAREMINEYNRILIMLAKELSLEHTIRDLI